MPTDGFLLVARRRGSSTSRQQRHFPNMEAVERAITRWRSNGFDVWWVFGPMVKGERRVVRSWNDNKEVAS